MCSSVGQTAPTRAEAALAAHLAAAIDDVAAALHADAASAEVASRLAAVWAMITAADPELAARAAGYTSS